MTLKRGNQVWQRFIVNQMPHWLRWLKSIHLPSHVRLWDRYLDITLPQKAYFSLGGESDEEEMLSNFFVPPPIFWEEMESEVDEKNHLKMYRMALTLTMDDFLHDLTLYAQQFEEIQAVYVFMVHRKEWFEILLNYLRSDLYKQWVRDGKLS